MIGRSLKAPQKCLCAERKARAHRRAGVGAGFTVLPPGHVEAAHELRIEGVRGVEHGEAQDVGGVLHDPVQVQDGEVLRPRRGRELGWARLGQRRVGAAGDTHHGGEDVLVKC